jgi:8-oxo-dGTP diphosphatase
MSATDPQTIEQVSAGGVVFREIGDGIEIAIVRIVPELRWQLPKGIIDKGETIEEAATREVREESGLVHRYKKWRATPLS